MPRDMHEALLRDDATRKAVAWCATLTPAIAEELVAGDEEVRVEVALNPSLPGELRDRLLGTVEHDTRHVGWLHALPLHERLRYLDSPVGPLRRAVATSGDLPPDARGAPELPGG